MAEEGVGDRIASDKGSRKSDMETHELMSFIPRTPYTHTHTHLSVSLHGVAFDMDICIPESTGCQIRSLVSGVNYLPLNCWAEGSWRHPNNTGYCCSRKGKIGKPATRLL